MSDLIAHAYLRALAIQAHMFGQMLRGEPTSFPTWTNQDRQPEQTEHSSTGRAVVRARDEARS